MYAPTGPPRARGAAPARVRGLIKPGRGEAELPGAHWRASGRLGAEGEGAGGVVDGDKVREDGGARDSGALRRDAVAREERGGADEVVEAQAAVHWQVPRPHREVREPAPRPPRPSHAAGRGGGARGRRTNQPVAAGPCWRRKASTKPRSSVRPKDARSSGVVPALVARCLAPAFQMSSSRCATAPRARPAQIARPLRRGALAGPRAGAAGLFLFWAPLRSPHRMTGLL